MAASKKPSGGSKSDKPWRTALMLAVNEKTEGGKKLRALAEKLVSEALEGDVQALKEIGDRLDGKPAQAIVGDSAADPINLLTRIERVIVNPTDTNGGGIPPVA